MRLMAVSAPARRVRLGVPLAACAILAIFVVTRLVFVEGFPYFLDEGSYAAFTWRGSNSLKDIWVSLTIGREPFQIWAGIPLVELGINPLTAMRAVSVMSGLLTLPVLFLLGRRLADDAVGLVAAALYALVPFAVVHNGIGIMESLVTLVCAAALLLQIDFARNPRIRLAVLLGLVAAVGVLTKENTKPAMAMMPLSLLLFDWRPEGRRERLTRWLGGAAIVVAMMVAADRLLHLSSYYDDFERWRANGFYTTRKVGDVIGDPFGSWDKAAHAYGPAFFEYMTVPLLIAMVAGVAIGLRHRRRITLLLAAWIAVPLLISLTFAALPYPRHVMYLLPPVLVLMAYAGVEGARWLRGRLAPRAATAAIAAIALLALSQALVLDVRVLAHPDTGPYPGLDQDQYVRLGGAPWDPIATEVRNRAQGDRVVVLSLTTHPDTLEMLLGPDDRYVFVAGNSPLASQAQLAVWDHSNPFADVQANQVLGSAGLRPVVTYARPDDGPGVTLYQRPG
jgi:4-amino-4-deoxy-L-arabinose transferase-like glycosyltransferase